MSTSVNPSAVVHPHEVVGSGLIFVTHNHALARITRTVTGQQFDAVGFYYEVLDGEEASPSDRPQIAVILMDAVSGLLLPTYNSRGSLLSDLIDDPLVLAVILKPLKADAALQAQFRLDVSYVLATAQLQTGAPVDVDKYLHYLFGVKPSDEVTASGNMSGFEMVNRAVSQFASVTPQWVVLEPASNNPSNQIQNPGDVYRNFMVLFQQTPVEDPDVYNFPAQSYLLDQTVFGDWIAVQLDSTVSNTERNAAATNWIVNSDNRDFMTSLMTRFMEQVATNGDFLQSVGTGAKFVQNRLAMGNDVNNLSHREVRNRVHAAMAQLMNGISVGVLDYDAFVTLYNRVSDQLGANAYISGDNPVTSRLPQAVQLTAGPHTIVLNSTGDPVAFRSLAKKAPSSRSSVSDLAELSGKVDNGTATRDDILRLKEIANLLAQEKVGVSLASSSQEVKRGPVVLSSGLSLAGVPTKILKDILVHLETVQDKSDVKYEALSAEVAKELSNRK